MTGRALAVLALLTVTPVHALSGVAREFMEIALAEEDRKDARELRKRFDALERDPKNLRRERRLADLQPLPARSGDPEGQRAIDHLRRDAFYRCE